MKVGTHAVMRLLAFEAPCGPPRIAAAWPGTPLFAALGADPGPAGGPGDRASAWLAIAVYDDADAARRACADGGEPPHWADGTSEHWCGLLAPCAHRGEINWLNANAPGPLFEPELARRHDGPLVAITSVGWVAGPDLDPHRVRDFMTRSLALRAGMQGVPGLRASNGFAFGTPVGGPDPITVSFWADPRAMGDFAYRPGRHADEMAYEAAVRSHDRSSFTRLQTLDRRGSWGGGDPLRPAEPAR